MTSNELKSASPGLSATISAWFCAGIRNHKIAYFPGCSLHSSAAEYGHTVRAVCETVGLDLVEPPGWICCGSSPAHSTDHALATVLPVTNLAIIEQMGLDEVTASCSACYARFIAASHALEHDGELAATVKEQVGYDYQNTVRVHHLLDTLVDRVGLDVIESHTKSPLQGPKCGLLLRLSHHQTGPDHRRRTPGIPNEARSSDACPGR